MQGGTAEWLGLGAAGPRYIKGQAKEWTCAKGPDALGSLKTRTSETPRGPDTVDNIVPALPPKKEYHYHNSHSLRAFRYCRISIINSAWTLRATG